MVKKVGVHLNISPFAGGEYQWWLTILEALGEINKEEKYEILLYADKRRYSEVAARYHLQLVDYPEVGNKFQYIINRLFENILPSSSYKRICHLWFPNLKKIKKENIDIWFAKTLKGVKKGLNISCVAPIFDLMYLYIPEFPEVTENISDRRKTTKDLCVRADILLADSTIGKTQIVESYGSFRKNLEQHVRVLPYIPADYIYDGKEADGFVKPFEKYILYPAQFWQHKNHLRLLKAIYTLREEGTIINIVLVGSEKNAGSDIKRFIDEKRLSSQVKILGYVTNEEIVSLYVNARGMIYPSLFGPTNIPPLEAMQLGCPCAISNIFGMPEQVGDAALLFNPQSVDDIKVCIKQIWENDSLCKELRMRGFEKSKLYGKKEFKKRLEDILDTIK